MCGCRFGTDPATSVLDPDCRAHGVENLYVTDGSFMPTGGSVPYTWTLYANALRVADRMLKASASASLRSPDPDSDLATKRRLRHPRDKALLRGLAQKTHRALPHRGKPA